MKENQAGFIIIEFDPQLMPKQTPDGNILPDGYPNTLFGEGENGRENYGGIAQDSSL